MATADLTDPAPGELPPRQWHPLTLTFTDPALEEQYGNEMAVTARRQVKFGAMSSIVLWLVGGFVMVRFIGVDPSMAAVVTAAMVLANGVALVLLRWLNGYNQHQLTAAAFTWLAAVAGMWLAASRGAIELYGAAIVMLIAIFAFVVLQLRFGFALIAAGVYLTIFTAFLVVAGARWYVTATQGFLIGSALLTAALGVRSLEMSTRERFLQRLQISTLAEQVEGLLRKYLSPNVAEIILADPHTSDLGGQVMEVSVLFADLQGFTSMSERSDPAAVTALLNRYFDVVVPTVLAEGGSVVNFAGDAVMAVFNAPEPLGDHALRACRVALRIQAAISSLSEFDQAPRFRIGINTGEALVGNIGSTEIRTFTVIGEAVNLAARLQTYARPGNVVIGPRTYEQVAGWVAVTPLTPATLKGVSAPVSPFRLRALLADEAPAEVTPART